MRHSRTMLFLALCCVPGSANAQRKPGTDVDVDVTVVDARAVGNAVRLNFVIHNRRSSGERLSALTIPTPQEAQAVTADAPPDRWLTISRYRGRPVAQWGALGDEMQPGDTSPRLSYTASGVLGVTSAWIRGDVPPQTLPSEDTANRVFHPEPDPVFDQGRAISVIGVVPTPSGGPPGMIGFLLEQIGYSCGVSRWVAPSGVCNDLTARLSTASAALSRKDMQAAREALRGFVDELDAQRAKHVSENGYWLLHTDAAYLLARI